MSEESQLRVFISWSGERSGSIAKILSEWLEDSYQFTKPFLSKDIGAGLRWNEVLAEALDKSYFGIIVLTPENLHSDWILFEAGALAKHLGKSRVIPCLIDLEPSDLSAPLNAFQCAKLPGELKRVVVALNEAQPDAWQGSKLDRSFQKFQPLFEREFDSVLKSQPVVDSKTDPPSRLETTLNEVLAIVRGLKQATNDEVDSTSEDNYSFYPENDRILLYRFLKERVPVKSYRNASMPALFQAAAKYVSLLDSSLDENEALTAVARYLVSDRPLKNLLDGLYQRTPKEAP